MQGARVTGGEAGSAPKRRGDPTGATLRLGQYPTPVFRADLPDLERGELWVKNDGVVNQRYGGNKVRKLERILSEAAAKGAKRVLTLGAAGSHHVLATTLFAREIGLPVVAVLTPQPWTEHAEATLRASLAAGLEAHPVRGVASVPFALARLKRRRDAFIPVGGSSVSGVMGYYHAALELRAQIDAGDLPAPHVLVAAVGSGATAAGLLAGCVTASLPCAVLGVSVAIRRRLARALVLSLAIGAIRRAGDPASLRRLHQSFRIDDHFLGRGYGYPSESGVAATQLASRTGLVLDPTYTAKTFAATLCLLGSKALPEAPFDPAQSAEMTGNSKITGPLRVLYWHTLSAVPVGALGHPSSPMDSLPTPLSELLHTE